jgi:hypothetical protein
MQREQYTYISSPTTWIASHYIFSKQTFYSSYNKLSSNISIYNINIKLYVIQLKERSRNNRVLTIVYNTQNCWVSGL